MNTDYEKKLETVCDVNVKKFLDNADTFRKYNLLNTDELEEKVFCYVYDNIEKSIEELADYYLWSISKYSKGEDD